MCDLSLDYCSVWREMPHVARIRHRCNACGATIGRGQPYLRHFSIFEGDVTTEQMCFACWLVREEFADAHGQSFIPSMLIEFLTECSNDGSENGDARWKKLLASVVRRRDRVRAHAR